MLRLCVCGSLQDAVLGRQCGIQRVSWLRNTQANISHDRWSMHSHISRQTADNFRRSLHIVTRLSPVDIFLYTLDQWTVTIFIFFICRSLFSPYIRWRIKTGNNSSLNKNTNTWNICLQSGTFFPIGRDYLTVNKVKQPKLIQW